MTFILSEHQNRFAPKDVNFTDEVAMAHDQAILNYPRYDDAYRAIEWLLAHDASTTGHPSLLMRWSTVSGPAPVPNILIVFKETQYVVEIHSLRVTAPEEIDEEISLL